MLSQFDRALAAAGHRSIVIAADGSETAGELVTAPMTEAIAFPYIVQSGGDAAGRMIGEAARVLRDGGDLAIVNFSYRGDTERDRRDIVSCAEELGLALCRDGVSEFSIWGGLAFHLHRPRGGQAPTAIQDLCRGLSGAGEPVDQRRQVLLAVGLVEARRR